MATEYLKVGARGWLHKQWNGSYYPDDLPEEWQLTYYANDFQVVLVPVEYWKSSIGYDLEQWLDAVNEGFRFYLECPAFEEGEDMALFQNQCAAMGEFLGGIIIVNAMDKNRLNLPCPVVKRSSFEDKDLCVGVFDEGLDDLRKARVWLDKFDALCAAKQKRVFVSHDLKNTISMEEILRMKVLVEMMAI